MCALYSSTQLQWVALFVAYQAAALQALSIRERVLLWHAQEPHALTASSASACTLVTYGGLWYYQRVVAALNQVDALRHTAVVIALTLAAGMLGSVPAGTYTPRHCCTMLHHINGSDHSGRHHQLQLMFDACCVPLLASASLRFSLRVRGGGFDALYTAMTMRYQIICPHATNVSYRVVCSEQIIAPLVIAHCATCSGEGFRLCQVHDAVGVYLVFWRTLLHQQQQRAWDTLACTIATLCLQHLLLVSAALSEADTIYSSNFDGLYARVMKTPAAVDACAKPTNAVVAAYRAFGAAQRIGMSPWKVIPALAVQWDKHTARHTVACSIASVSYYCTLHHTAATYTQQMYQLSLFGAATSKIEAATVDGDLTTGVQFIGQTQGLIKDIPT
eukprot:21471-Heterococcus_DN1.PRE.5